MVIEGHTFNPVKTSSFSQLTVEETSFIYKMEKPDCDITTNQSRFCDKNNAINRHDSDNVDGDCDDDCVILEQITAKSPKRIKTSQILPQPSQSEGDNIDNIRVEDGIIGMKVRSPSNRSTTTPGCSNKVSNPNTSKKSASNS